MSEWTRIPHDGDYDNLDSTLIIPITQKEVHTQNLPRIIQGEENADILTFETDRFYNGVDLTSTVISIIYKNANGTFYERAVNVEYSDDKLRFSWVVSKNATACKGILVINLEFDGLDAHKEVITVKSVRFPIEIEPAVLGKEISDYKSDNWVEETNARVKNLENECRELSGDITDLDEKLSQKVDSNTVASVSQLGMIKPASNNAGLNISGIIVNEDGSVSINAISRYGIMLMNGILGLNPATQNEVMAGTEQYRPVTPKTLKPFIEYSRTPTQVGVWVDGTPIWRVAFDREFTKADAPDIWLDKAFRIIDLIDVWKDYDLVRLFLNSEIEANTGFEATPELNIIDNYACIHDNSYWWDLPENAMLDDDTILRIGGFVEFVTPASNIKTT